MPFFAVFHRHLFPSTVLQYLIVVRAARVRAHELREFANTIWCLFVVNWTSKRSIDGLHVCNVHCTMRLFPVLLVACWCWCGCLVCVCFFLSFGFPILQFDCGFQQIKFMAMAKRTKIPYLNSLKCQTYHFFSLSLSSNASCISFDAACNAVFVSLSQRIPSSRHFSSYFGHLFLLRLIVSHLHSPFARVDKRSYGPSK